MTSMSYCMFENTSNEMGQLLGTMNEADSMDSLNLNSYELRAFAQMKEQCAEFLAECERLDATVSLDFDDE